jgi:hypothetical protein
MPECSVACLRSCQCSHFCCAWRQSRYGCGAIGWRTNGAARPRKINGRSGSRRAAGCSHRKRRTTGRRNGCRRESPIFPPRLKSKTPALIPAGHGEECGSTRAAARAFTFDASPSRYGCWPRLAGYFHSPARASCSSAGLSHPESAPKTVASRAAMISAPRRDDALSAERCRLGKFGFAEPTRFDPGTDRTSRSTVTHGRAAHATGDILSAFLPLRLGTSAFIVFCLGQ